MGYAAGRNPSPAQLKKLLRIFSEDLRKNPGDLLLRLKLAEVLRLLGRFEEAVSLYGSVAWSYAVAGNLVQAIMLCKLILELRPDHQETQQMLAKLYASKRIREEKQSVSVVQVDGRWVADPRQSGSTPAPVSKLGATASGIETKPAPSGAPLAPAPGAFDPGAPARLGNDLARQAAEARARARDPGEHSAVVPNQVPSHVVAGQADPRAPTLEVGDHESRAEQATKRALPTSRSGAMPRPPADFGGTGPLPRPAGWHPQQTSTLPAAPPVDPTLPPTYVGQSPLTREQREATARAEADERSIRQQLDDAHPPFDEEADEEHTQGETPSTARKKRSTLKLQTVTNRGEVQPTLDLGAPPPRGVSSRGTGAIERRGRSLRDGLASPPSPLLSPSARSTQGYTPLPALRSATGTPLTGPQMPARAIPPTAEPAASTTELHDPVGRAHPRADESTAIEAMDESTAIEEPTNVQEPPTKVEAADPTLLDEPDHAAPLDPLDQRHRPTEAHDPVGHATPSGGLDALAAGLDTPTEDMPDSTPPAEPPRRASAEVELATPDGEAVEVLAGYRPPRSAKATARIETDVMSTLLRQDAELAYHEAKSTDCYAAIQREVLLEVHDQEDSALDDLAEQAAERDLASTLQEIPSRVEDLPDSVAVPTIPLFSDLDSAAFIALVERLEARLYAPEEFVIREGEPGDSLLLVSAGRLSVLKEHEGKQVELALLGPGSFFGEFGLLTDHRRHASVRCLEETEVLELRRDVLADLIRDHPSVQRTLRAFYERRVLQMVLATSSLFRAVSPRERDEVIRRFTTRRFMEGEVIVREGDQAEAFYVILVGEVAVTCLDDSGKDVQVGALAEGQYFGEMSLISGYPAEATVRTTRVTETLVLDHMAFYELASHHPEIWAEVQRESQARAEENDRILAERRSQPILV